MSVRSRFVTAFIATFVLFFLILPSAVTALYYLLEGILDLEYIPTPWHFAFFLIAFAIGWWWMIWSNLYIFQKGKGTSLEVAGRVNNPTQELVITGPYAYCRNPMAFGFVIAYVLGIGFLLHTVWALIVTPVAFLGLGIYLRTWEEKGLERRFGSRYKTYREAIPSFVPRPWRRLDTARLYQ